MYTPTYPHLQYLSKSDPRIEDFKTQAVSLSTVYRCSTIRNAYHGSTSHLFSVVGDFHTTLESAKKRIEIARRPGSQFRISQCPALVLNSSEKRRIFLVDSENLRFPFGDPRPRVDVKISDLSALSIITEMEEKFSLAAFWGEENIAEQLLLPLFSYRGNRVNAGPLQYREQENDVRLDAISYVWIKLADAILSHRSKPGDFVFNPYYRSSNA
jgi:hypothetical protein